MNTREDAEEATEEEREGGRERGRVGKRMGGSGERIMAYSWKSLSAWCSFALSSGVSISICTWQWTEP